MAEWTEFEKTNHRRRAKVSVASPPITAKKPWREYPNPNSTKNRRMPTSNPKKTWKKAFLPTNCLRSSINKEIPLNDTIDQLTQLNDFFFFQIWIVANVKSIKM